MANVDLICVEIALNISKVRHGVKPHANVCYAMFTPIFDSPDFMWQRVCEWNTKLLLETNIIVDLQFSYCLIMWIIFNIATPSVVGGNTGGT